MGVSDVQIIRTVDDMRYFVKTAKKNEKTIGFVPTMGYLHEGHVSLMTHAKKENDCVVVCVFVNPLQFNDTKDLDVYPRDETHDVTVCKNIGVDVLFMPPVSEIYPQAMGITMTLQKRIGVLCDRTRPGHFSGVLTVLSKLFHITEPTHVYFGLKDAQQVAVVDLLIQDLHFDTILRRIETVREADGLAKSSRNVNLTPEERTMAPTIYCALKEAVQQMKQGIKTKQEVMQLVETKIEVETTGTIDYIEILSYPELEEVSELKGTLIVACAVNFSKARLIDNVIMTCNDE